MTEPILHTIDLSKTYGDGPTEVAALSGVTLSVMPGELVAVMGPSGCGKSTLLHLAGALEVPTKGRVLVGGKDLLRMNLAEQAALRRRDVGYVFQRLNLIPALTAVENVMLPLELDGIGVRQAKTQATEALKASGLDGSFDRFPDDFSGGQQQRIAIARAIVGTRKLLLADEPTGSLDTLSSDQVIETLSQLPERMGTAVVMVTHEPRFAAWADRVIFMRDGSIVDESSEAPTPSASAATLVGGLR